jgi:hypothetical protein
MSFILTVPRITAPVYLNGNFAAIPNTVFWYTPFATTIQISSSLITFINPTAHRTEIKETWNERFIML